MVLPTTQYDWKAVFRNTVAGLDDPHVALKKLWKQQVVPAGQEFAFVTQLLPDYENELSYLLKDRRVDALIRKYASHSEQFAQIWPFLRSSTSKCDAVWAKLMKFNRELPFLMHESSDVLSVQLLMVKNKSEAQLVKKYQDDMNALAVLWPYLTPNKQQETWDSVIVSKDLEIAFLAHANLQNRESKISFGRVTFLDGKRTALLEKYQANPQIYDFLMQYFGIKQ